ncbi:thioredoxin-like protein [Scenedesmus sp. NREL 46B-D3]|nr:thioredoxin-like protein [Scenedesmus sp. NREL 46B-D3]
MHCCDSVGSRRVAFTVHAKQQQRQATQQQQQSSRSTAVQAAATGATTATASTASPGWLKSLLPFGRKQAAEPLIPTISRAQLESLLQGPADVAASCSQVPLVVIFSATWCGPCKVMMQRMENIAQQLGPRGVKVVKIDTDESEGGSELATELSIYKLPTIIFCGPNDGKAAVQVQGLVKEAVLLDLVLHKSQFMGNDLAGCMKW